MRVAVLIMSTEMEPSISNTNTMKSTFIAETNRLMSEGKLKHEYKFIFYSCKDDVEELTVVHNDGYDNIYVKGPESVYRTFEKSHEVFSHVINDNYDWFVRINISTFINIRLLDKALIFFNKDTVYANVLNAYINADSEYHNDIYARGDFMIISNKVMNGIVDKGNDVINWDDDTKYRIGITHVDDCLIGFCIMKFFGNEYYKHFKMLKYNYVPFQLKEVNINAIATRVKTIPPGETHSGYSWADNEWRRKDCEKMCALNETFKKLDYTRFIESDIYPKKNEIRPVLCVTADNIPLENVKDYIMKKTREL